MASKDAKTHLEEHEILDSLSYAVLESRALSNATLRREPGPPSEVRGIHGIWVAELVSKTWFVPDDLARARGCWTDYKSK
jgi:hypothetical protein